MLTTPVNKIAQFLALPCFSKCSPHSMEIFTRQLHERSLAKGTALFQANRAATQLYYILNGAIELTDPRGHKTIQREGFIGSEAILEHEQYGKRAIALEDSSVIVIETTALQQLNNANNTKSELFRTLFSRQQISDTILEKPPSSTYQASKILYVVGWLSTVIIPILVFWYAQHQGFDWAMENFFFILAAFVVILSFRIVPPYVPTLFAILAIAILGIAPDHIVLGGYASSEFFLALSVLGLASVIIHSGFAYRVVLWVLRILPTGAFTYSVFLYIFGVLLTPGIPSGAARANILSSLYVEMLDASGYAYGKRVATGMALSAYFGMKQFANVFLTGSGLNFVLLGMLPQQERNTFTWAHWLFAALPAAGVFFVVFVVFIFLATLSKEKAVFSKQHIRQQLNVLGATQQNERVAVGGLILFVIGVTTYSLHKLEPAWIGLTLLFVLLAMDFIPKEQFRKSIDWPFLVFFGGIIGVSHSITYVGLENHLLPYLQWISTYTGNNIYLLIFALFFILIPLRTVLGRTEAIVLLAIILFPFAQAHAINPWVLGFIILTLSSGWFFATQNTWYVLFSETALRQKRYNQQRFLIYAGLLSNSTRLLAVCACVPFWQHTGIL